MSQKIKRAWLPIGSGFASPRVEASSGGECKSFPEVVLTLFALALGASR